MADILPDIDPVISSFLNDNSKIWKNWNISHIDGKILFDLVVSNRYRNILEIGTSTGYSTIWLAWAASKTGGRVRTIEIEKKRYNIAIGNFKDAGVTSYIDFLPGNAHFIVPALEGPFDFIFCDADKEWNLQYFLSLEPKLVAGGRYTAHNILWDDAKTVRFVDYMKGKTNFRKHIEEGSGEGILVSYKIS